MVVSLILVKVVFGLYVTAYVLVPNLSGCNLITDPGECLKAAAKVGMYGEVYEENVDDEPPGCFIYDEEEIWFNYGLGGTYELSYEYQQVCHEHPDEPNYHGNVIFQYGTYKTCVLCLILKGDEHWQLMMFIYFLGL